MAQLQIHAALRGEKDAYDVGRERLLGRHTAGLGLLRAAVSAVVDQGKPLVGYGPVANAATFSALAKQIDPSVGVQWAPSDNPAALAQVGVLYLGDPVMGASARLRMRAGVAAFSLCGITHTTASQTAMDEIAGLLREPVAPWDALICTSTAVVETVRRVHEAEKDYLRWRFGAEARIASPQLPLIPLGVHTESFAFSNEERLEARAALGIAADEVVVLYVGRYGAHGKAHPLVMFQGLEAAARRSEQKIVAVLCGWPATPEMDAIFRDGAGQFAPSVRTLFTDGRKGEDFSRSWAAADIFLSLVDGIQETFGLTPIEAKAAGLPVICTDWNGYRDTVRDGVDGFRIRTWTPGPGMGEPLARGLETGTLNYSHYAWGVAASTVVDLDQLVERLADLAANPELRRTMGAAGRADALARFEWARIYAQYQELWGDLTDRRAAALEGDMEWLHGAPGANPARLDPFQAFGHYPTAQIGAASRVRRVESATAETVAELIAHRLFAQSTVPPALALAAWQALDEERTVSELAVRCGSSPPALARAVGLLAKMSVVRLDYRSARNGLQP